MVDAFFEETSEDFEEGEAIKINKEIIEFKAKSKQCIYETIPKYLYPLLSQKRHFYKTFK